MNYTVTQRNKLITSVLMLIGVAAVIYGFMQDPVRAWANLLVNTFFFMAIALCGTFFLAANYVALAGWAVSLKRVCEAMGQFLPVAAVLMLIIFFAAGHDLYHWTHSYLYDPASPEYDKIIAGKQGWLNYPFYITRMILYFVIWIGYTMWIRRESKREDLNGGMEHYKRSYQMSAVFIVLFGVTSSTSAWDFLMSIDTHWFSTLFGWYTFSGLFVSGMAMICLLTIYLKKRGYLQEVNENHLHDVGKFMFGFSIFWTYLWFSQFMLYWYANIPEEVAYYQARWEDGYKGLWIFNMLVNFLAPFLVLMSRDAKRNFNFLAVAATIIFFGHWIDVFLMVMPGTVKANWGIGFGEIGMLLGFLGMFLFVVFRALSRAPLVVKNHPFLKESIHHHI